VLFATGGANERALSFEINPEMVVAVKRRCIELDYPLLEEYDFRNDTGNSPSRQQPLLLAVASLITVTQ
jgi:hypothetical protein